jgi:hypothetical protein
LIFDFRLGNKEIEEIEPCYIGVMRSFLTEHVSLHKIDEVYVDVKTGEISIKCNQGFENIFSRSSGLLKILYNLIRGRKLDRLVYSFKRFLKSHPVVETLLNLFIGIFSIVGKLGDFFGNYKQMDETDLSLLQEIISMGGENRV